MKKRRISLKRVFMGVIVGILICFLVFFISTAYRNMNDPFKWSYKSQIINVCKNADASGHSFDIIAIGDEGYKVSYESGTSGFVYVGALQNAIEVFNDIVDFTEEHENHPMHGKDLTVYVRSGGNVSFGYVEIIYDNGKTYVTAASHEINSSGYSDICDLHYGVAGITLNGNTILSIDPLLEFSDIEQLEFIGCHYLGSKETAPNQKDINMLREKYPDCVIIVDHDTIE